MNLYFIFKQITPTKILINKIDGLLFLCLQWRGISSKFQTSHFCWINYYRGNWEEFIWVRQMGIIQIYNSKPPMIFKWRKKVSNFPLLLDQLSEGFIWVRQRGIIQIYTLRPSMIFAPQHFTTKYPDHVVSCNGMVETAFIQFHEG